MDVCGQVDNHMASKGSEDHLHVVRPPAEALSRQGLPYFVGISGNTTGARGLALNLVIIPPGGSAVPHLHDGYESAIYHLQGRVKEAIRIVKPSRSTILLNRSKAQVPTRDGAQGLSSSLHLLCKRLI